MAENVKTLVPVSCDPLSTFKNKNNVDTTIYKVEATDENGGSIDEELRSFQTLEIGVAQEFRVERYEHDEYGVSYTLYPAEKTQPSPGGRLGPKVDALRREVDALTERFGEMEDRVADLETSAPLLRRRPEEA